MNARQIAFTGLFLFLFAAIGAGLVAFTYQSTKARIAANEQAVLLRNLHQIISPERHDNDLLKDTVEVRDPAFLGTHEEVTVYRAFMGEQPVAVVMTPIAPDGYGGAIKLLVGIDVNGRLMGVRVLSHHETPGLGDRIETERSDWILGFTGRSLNDPPESKWAVKRDGGVFDQFTGATITPRAVVRAVKRCLLYFREHREELFARPPRTVGDDEEADEDG
ncbi:electron transport complex subunit RsxG [Thiohalobacter sp. IOR34]|uniref:electron transport complex subunit RsxG n=1 Tax=Thiohalobacter sp. IOR34 TaxID=3057176 RepID=UPI0025B1A73B|nr:electron transport complex subunit RsxG [Thiohalobacter sp. IOR34]WJW76051.1 electron transport complex subunit RsxG [Thiohalobacter sp. IOR34]